MILILFIYLFFFFQAEDGIRDYKVTGVQTCALPISDLGVRRVSVGAVLANVAMDAVIKAGEELIGPGTFGFLEGTNGYDRIGDLMFKR